MVTETLGKLKIAALLKEVEKLKNDPKLSEQVYIELKKDKKKKGRWSLV